jgi:hypothetical protein
MFWLWWILIFVGTSFLIAKLQEGQKPDDAEPGDLQFPTIRENEPYTIVFGTIRVEDPIVAWWGDKKTYPIVEKIDGGPFGDDEEVTIGYWYEVSIQLHFCEGVVDGVKQLYYGDIMFAPNPYDYTGQDFLADGTASYVINEPSLFGGEKEGGGLIGTFTIRYGEQLQNEDTYLQGQLGNNISASRGVLEIICKQVRWGTSPFINNVAALIKRTDTLTSGDTQWYPSKSEINYGINPAHMIRECLTDNQWGAQQPVSMFDETEWQAVADVLYTEGFGLNFKWKSTTRTLEALIADVLRHIDAVLYQDMTNLLFHLKLIRFDYDPDTLDIYDDDDIVSIEEFTRPSYGEIPDEIWIEYWDRLHHKEVAIPEQDLALIDQQGGKIIPSRQKFLGIMDDSLATKVAARERRQQGAMNARFKLRAKRTMYNLYPGDVFKFTYSPLGIESMIVRVIDVDYGSLRDGEIVFNCIEDVFGMENSVVASPPSTGWSDPNNDAADVTELKLIETPYHTLVEAGSQANVDAMGNDEGMLSVQAKDPTGDSFDYLLNLRDSPAGSFYEDTRGAFVPSGLLSADMSENAQDVIVTLTNNDSLLLVDVDSYCLIGNEILKVKAIDSDNDQVTLARGVLDTVPEAHSGPDSGGSNADRVWFMGMVNKIGGTIYSATDQPGVKLLSRTIKSELDIGDATAYNASVFNSRLIRPYPPGNFKINGQSYPSSFSGEPTISWNHRDRKTQLGAITEHSNASVGPEVGTTYTLQIYDEDNNLIHTESGMTGTSYTYDSLEERIDSGLGSGDPLNSKLRFVLKSVRGGYDSWQSYDVTVNRV